MTSLMTVSDARALLATDPGQALREAQAIANRGPNPAALRVIADAFRRMGRPDHAHKAELVAIQASLRDPRLNAAELALREGRYSDAAANAAECLEEAEDDLLAATIMAEAMYHMRRLPLAESTLRTVVARVPDYTRAQILLARSLMMQCRIREAAAGVEAQLARRPDNSELWNLLGQLRIDAFDFDGAAAVYQRLLQQNIGLSLNHALALRFAGRTKESEEAFRRLLNADRSAGELWWGLVTLRGGDVTSQDRKEIEKALTSVVSQDDTKNASFLHIALATILDRLNQPEQAFQHFAAGNRLRADTANYEPEKLTKEVDQAIASLNGAGHREASDPDDRDVPVFIIGMPRSGSTLVERSLGSHSSIEAVGELPIIPRMVDELDAEAGRAGGYRDLIDTFDTVRLNDLGSRYLDRSREFRTTNKRYFTDKLHMNWRHLDLITRMLPNARFIDVRRNAVDCCWSNFKMFASGHPAAHDLEHLANFYRNYVRLADHAAAIESSRFLTLSYEATVDDFEGHIRRLLGFLGLEFEPACLEFHRLQGPISTASAEQVRHPLNRRGIGAADPYRRWLGPLIDALGPLAN